MSAALTFGSVGDVIALCGLAVELSRALSHARGSAAEYRCLRNDVDQFIEVLKQVIATYQQFQPSPWLDGLANVTKSIVAECSSLLQEVLAFVQGKYGDSLQPGGSGNTIKDICKKLEFSLKERDKIQLLNRKLNNAAGRLGLLSSCAAM
jgi:hypothetical protein